MSKLLSFFCCLSWHFQHSLMPVRVTQGTGTDCSLRMMRTVEPGLPGKRPSGAWMVALEAPLPPLMEVLSPRYT